MAASHDITIHRAAAIRDAAGLDCLDGAVAVRAGVILASGPAAQVFASVDRSRAAVIDLPETLLVPAMVNAHAHLDLTTLGPVPYSGDFRAWVRHVIDHRPTDAQAIAHAVRQGLSLSRAGGVGWVGDIAATATAATARLDAGDDTLPGVSFVEWLGRGERFTDLAARSRAQFSEAMRTWAARSPASPAVRLGLEPHAPYSTADALYDEALALAEAHDLPLCTHLAELPDEMDLLGLGAADGRADVHPIDWFASYLGRRRWLLAHCNHVTDAHIVLLAATGASVAYCPVASDYFGHRDHRYRDMLAAGVNVCLGTDSILCQATDAAQPMSIFEQMRYLYRRDGADPAALLAMATTCGLRALGIDERHATFAIGSTTRLAAVPFEPHAPRSALEQALRGDYPVQSIES